MKKQITFALLGGLLTGTLLSLPVAHADRCWRDKHGRRHCDNGNHHGWNRNGRDRRGYDNEPFLDWKTKKILKGGLVGAGVGAGAGVLLDKPVGRLAVAGAGVGAGTQAIRYSRTLRRHPIVKSAAYGTVIGAGASQLTRERSLGKGALWGGAIGTGVGALRHMD